MTIKEYLDNLNKLKRLAVSRWGSLTSLERDVVDGAFEWLVDNLEIKKGQITVDEDLARIMDEFVASVVNTVNNVPAYQSNLKRFLQDLTTIQTNNKLFHKTTNNFNIETAGVNNVQKAVVGEIIEQYTGNGLNAHFAAPLKDNIFRNILTGANMKEVKEVLRAYILGGQDGSGKLGRYLDQTAMMAVDSYTGAINQQLVKEFSFTGYIISGSLIETSSKQCVYAVDEANKDKFGYLPFEEWEKILDIARNNPKARLIEGTTIKTLPLNKLHWGCRHDFTPIYRKEDKKEKPEVKEQKKDPAVVPVSSFKEAKTKNQAKQVSKDIFEKNLGLRITKVSASSQVSVEQLNKMNSMLQQLTNEYNLSPVTELGFGTQISFSSTARTYGFVKSGDNGSKIMTMNFGHLSDKGRSNVVDPKLAYLRTKSKADADREDMATVVHEFAHVITVDRQKFKANSTKELRDFWAELINIRKEYHAELSATLEKNNHEEAYAQIFLGKYASTNANEFMAEAFTEYRLYSNPSKYAKKVGLLIDKYFKK